MRILLPILLLLVRGLAAQPAASLSNDDHALIQQLVQRVKELEDQVRALKAGNAAAPEETAASVPRQQPAAPPPAQAAAPGDMMHDVNAGLPGMHFRGFSD